MTVKPKIEFVHDGRDDELTATVTVKGDPTKVVDWLCAGLPRDVLEALLLALAEELLKHPPATNAVDPHVQPSGKPGPRVKNSSSSSS